MSNLERSSLYNRPDILQRLARKQGAEFEQEFSHYVKGGENPFLLMREIKAIRRQQQAPLTESQRPRRWMVAIKWLGYLGLLVMLLALGGLFWQVRRLQAEIASRPGDSPTAGATTMTNSTVSMMLTAIAETNATVAALQQQIKNQDQPSEIGPAASAPPTGQSHEQTEDVTKAEAWALQNQQKVKLEPIEITQFPVMIKAQGSGIAQFSQVTFAIGAQSIILPASRVDNDNTIQFELPATALRDVAAPCAQPLTAQITISSTFKAEELTINQPTVTVAGVPADASDTTNTRPYKNTIGAYLWNSGDTNQRDPAQHVVQPENPSTVHPDFALLSNGDQVQILECQKQGDVELYQIRVKTNQAETNQARVVDKQGWVLRSLIDGQP
jgi:hypothetical protein